MNDPAFHYSLTGLGLGQDPLGGGASVQTGDPTNSLNNVDPATGLINPATGEPGAPGDSGAGTVTFTGGGGGGGGGGSPAASTTGTTASSVLSTLTTGNTPLILGAIAVVGGIAAVAYLAHRKTVQGGGRSRSSGRHSSHRAYARRR